jgi:hypothetical protein
MSTIIQANGAGLESGPQYDTLTEEELKLINTSEVDDLTDVDTEMDEDDDTDSVPGEVSCQVQGRTALDNHYPTKPYAKATFDPQTNSFLVRTDDANNPSFWLETRVNLFDLDFTSLKHIADAILSYTTH